MSELQIVLNKLEEMSSDIKEIKTDVAGLKTDVAGLKTDVAGLKTDVAGLKTDVAELKTDVKDLKTRMGKVETRLEAVFEQTGGLIEFRHNTQKTLNFILEQQLSLTHIVGEHAVAIRTLQRRLSQQEDDSEEKSDISVKYEAQVSNG